MPRFAPSISRQDFLDKLSGYLASKPDFLEDHDPDLSNETGILSGVRKALVGADDSIFAAVRKDWAKIDFDLENLEIARSLPFTTGTGLTGVVCLPNGLSFLACAAGGDWEHPLIAILYHDGKGFRGYVPTQGNTFNRKTKAAFGNDEEADILAYMTDFADHPAIQGRSRDEVATEIYNNGNPQLRLDQEALLADIAARIQIRG